MKKCSITSLCQEEVSRLVIVSLLRNIENIFRVCIELQFGNTRGSLGKTNGSKAIA